jgi:hypothetical protein
MEEEETLFKRREQEINQTRENEKLRAPIRARHIAS